MTFVSSQHCFPVGTSLSVCFRSKSSHTMARSSCSKKSDSPLRVDDFIIGSSVDWAQVKAAAGGGPRFLNGLQNPASKKHGMRRCYFNSAMRCLGASAEFMEAVNGKRSGKTGRLVCEFYAVLYGSNEAAALPSDELMELLFPDSENAAGKGSKEWGLKTKQQDPQEFLVRLFDRLHSESITEGMHPVEKFHSFPYDCFGGYERKHRMCEKCERVRETEEPIMQVALHHKDRATLSAISEMLGTEL